MNFQNSALGSMLLPPRLTRTGAPFASVEGINTTTLADGAFVYCVENQGGYQLDRTSALAPNGNTVIAPATGPGRWVLKLGSTGAAIAAWSATKIVDSQTTVPPAQQDGSVSAPYSTIQAAIDANPGIFLGLQLVANVYAESVVIPVGTPVLFVPVTGVQVTGVTLDAGASAFTAGGLLLLGSLTLGTGAAFIALGALAVLVAVTLATDASLQSFVATQVGDVTIGTSNQPALLLKNSFSVNSVTAADPLDTGSIVLLSASDDYPSNADTSVLGPVNAAGYTLQVTGTNCNGNITCMALAATGCDIRGDVLADAVYLRDSDTLPGKAFTSTGLVQIIGSKVAAATWANALGQPFELDDFSNYWIKVNGTVLTNAGEKVITSDVVP